MNTLYSSIHLDSSSECKKEPSEDQSSDLIVCQDVNSAFNLQHRNSTAYIFASGKEVTHFLKPENTSKFFDHVSDVAFYSNKSKESASVVC